MRQDRKHLASRIGVRAISILALVGMLASLGKAQYIISTIAGGGPPNGAKATTIGLQPVGIAVDAAGNQYISSQSDGRVYKVDTAGTVTVLAGGGSYGYSGDGGPATSALIWYPSGVAVDRAGNVYIADSNNNRIRKVATNGVITTVAGNGTYGYSGEGGQAIGAQLADASGSGISILPITVASVSGELTPPERLPRWRATEPSGTRGTSAKPQARNSTALPT